MDPGKERQCLALSFNFHMPAAVPLPEGETEKRPDDTFCNKRTVYLSLRTW